MSRARLLLLVLLLGSLPAGVPAPVTAAPVAAAPLASRLAARLAAAKARPGTLGAVVVSLADGQVVAEREPDKPLVPASVAKIATAVAALDLLGPGFEFTTSLDARGTLDPATGTLTGDLVLRGSGDPGLSRRDREADPMWPLSSLAKAAADAGIRRVTGALVLDDGPFDRRWTHPSWPASDLDDWYGAPVAGLSWNDGCVTVVVRGAGSAGAAARVLAPSTSGPWALEPDVTTWDDRRTQVGAIWAEGRRLRVTGGLPPSAEYRFDVPVPDPLAFAGAAAVAALAAAGVRVEQGARPAASPADRAPARTLATVRHGLPGTLRVMNRRSQNLYAALVFKACGAEREGVGSWESGERAVRAALEARGAGGEGLRVVDGSGLSKESRLSARSLARLLVALDGDPLRGPILRDSLATPGEEGTLARRLRDPRARERVRAKTGTLARSGVHALAGYVDGPGGAAGWAFAVLVNDGRVDGRDVADDLVREMLDG